MHSLKTPSTIRYTGCNSIIRFLIFCFDPKNFRFAETKLSLYCFVFQPGLLAVLYELNLLEPHIGALHFVSCLHCCCADLEQDWFAYRFDDHPDNYFVDSQHLEIEEKNIFTATELATLIPACNKEIYNTLIDTNSWMKS